jgi:hypothetical protein
MTEDGHLHYLLSNLSIYNNVHESLPLDPIVSNLNPAHMLANYFLKVHFNIILSSTLRSPKKYLSFLSGRSEAKL